MGSRGQSASPSDAPQFVQWTHSVNSERDFVSQARAQFLGLSRQHEVVFEQLAIGLTWDLDPRIAGEDVGCSWESSVFPCGPG